MTNSDVLPKPYAFPRKKSRPRKDFGLRIPPYVRKYADRNVKTRSREYTMQQARKDIERKTREASEESMHTPTKWKEKPKESSFEEDSNDRFWEWKPEDESLVFNIRPGRKMFPFLKDFIKAEDYHRKYRSFECKNLREPVTQRVLTSEDSNAPSHIVLTKNASSFICEPLDDDQIVEII